MRKKKNSNKNKSSKKISLARDLLKPRWKIRLAGGFIVVFFAAISLKAFDLQVLNRDRALELARQQHDGLLTTLPQRGKIFDTNGKELAVNINSKSIYVRPGSVKNPDELSKGLSKYLNISQKKVSEILASGKPFVWLQRLAEPNVVTKLEGLKLEGVGFIEEPKRVYPNGYLAGQVLGFTNIDLKGIEGMEYYLDEFLAGKPGRISVKKDARGKLIRSNTLYVEPGKEGHNVVLTVDSNIQHMVEKELQEGVESANAERGIAVLMNPETGAILAMASYPPFDPNKFKDYSEKARRNLPVWYSFEPGSTMKAFLLAAALEEKKVTPTTEFDCENGKRRIGRWIINDVKPHGMLTVSDVIKVSSNICASKIAEALGKDKLYDYLKKFGFGEETGISLPGESAGKVNNPRGWKQAELATASYGQGMSATALQLASALSAIANGGYLMKPFIVKRVIDPDGKVVQEGKPEIIRRVISYDTAVQAIEILEGVVSEDGTGKKAAVPGYGVAGKTGTAQVPDPKNGGYDSDRYMASFIGFAPADDPKLAFVVVVDNPKKIHYGGVVAAPIFKEVMEKVLFYLGVPPEREFAEEKVMPDLRGMSARDILRWAEEEGVRVKLKGSGFASDQKPEPGQRIKNDTVCSIELRQRI
ncbi:MAG TPA: penicillin-binding transpeptidase domain-containing protein [Thermodesulfobacteriota bacterium]|nr:penicillin-binding transpeptidase domain-containing protein [Thermodesulfobacteriota bacterium]